MMMQPDEFDRWCAVAAKWNVEEFSVGEVAVKFGAKAAPPQREKDEPLPVRNALEMLGRETEGLPLGEDVIEGMPPAIGADGHPIEEPATPTRVQWATSDPAQET